MLNIRFERNSAPITDTELLSVVDGIQPALAVPEHPDKDYALLLARMLFRINALKAELAKVFPPVKDAA